jgi:HK97 family phage major capsid protein
MKELVEKREELNAKRKKLKQVFDEAGKDMDMDQVECLEGDSKSKVDAVRKMNAEIEDLQKEVEGLAEVERASKNTESQVKFPEEGKKTFGDLFVESEAFKSKGAIASLDIGIKTLMETSAGWEPEDIRTGRVVLDAQRPIQVIDAIPMGSTSQSAVVYMQETTFTNNAAETSEGGTYGEAELALSEQSSTVRKIAVWIPITDEQLEDVAQVRGYVNNRLRFMLRQRLDKQILEGDGSAPNLEGIRQNGSIQSQAKGTDPVPDAIYKAMTAVMVTGQAQPNLVIFHPNDWQQVRLLRTSDGIYIWGNPSEAGPERIWGLPVIKAQAIVEGNALIGDFANFVELAERRGIEVQITNAHSDFFIKGKQAIRADMRAALPIYRPAAFCEITGI